MTAEKMFNGVGMKKYQSDDWIEYRNEDYSVTIAFYLKDKKLGCRVVITPALYEAITQQMKELRWI